MIESPRVDLRVQGAERFQTMGPLAERVTEFARRWSQFYDRALPQCSIAVHQVPSEHSGLGVGTQLGLATALALNTLEKLPAVTPAELAISVGRGQRSAVGTYGFVHGGLIAERGKGPGDVISPLDARVAIPESWRFVLVRPKIATSPGLAGLAEAEAFEGVEPVSEAASSKLVELAREQLLPSAVLRDFSSFADALDRYCYLAGMCFSSIQGGPFNGPVLTKLADQMRGAGAPAVGQSSWGPTLFTVFPSTEEATQFADQLQAIEPAECEVSITRPNNCGSQVVESADQ